MSLLGRGLLVARRQVAATMVTATKQSQVVAEECWTFGGIAGPLMSSLVFMTSSLVIIISSLVLII